MKRTTNYKDYKMEKLKDPKAALVYLEVAIEEFQQDNDLEVFLIALRDVIEAQGGIGKLAENTQLNRQHLYKVLSEEGNPKLSTVNTILNDLGFQLSIKPME